MSPSERTIHLEAVVLRHTDWGEADRLLVVFGRETGKIRAIAKGVRKLHSRKAGHLEPFTRVKLLLARGRDFWIVTQAETVDAYLPIREDLLRTAYAAYAVVLLDRFTYEEGQNRALYQSLIDTLQLISFLPDPFPALRYYEIHLLGLLGFRPELVNCVCCGTLIKPEDQFLDAAQGGALCPRCGEGNPSARPISRNALRFLRHYQRSTFQEATRLPLTPALKREVEALLSYYLTYWLERRLNSPVFLHEVRSGYSVDE